MLKGLLLDAMVDTMMEAMVGGIEDGLVDGVDEGLVDGMVDNRLVDCVVDNWCRLRQWDDTAAHLPWKLHRDLPAFGSAKLGRAFLKSGGVQVGRGKLEAALFHNFLTLNPGEHHRSVLALLLRHRGLQSDARGGRGEFWFVVAHLGLIFAVSVAIMTGGVLAFQIIRHVDTLHLSLNLSVSVGVVAELIVH